MRIIKRSDRDYGRRIMELDRCMIPDLAREQEVREILMAVRERGDRALLDLTEKFGGPRLWASRIRVPESEIRQALADFPSGMKKALAVAQRNVADFARRSLRKPWSERNQLGIAVGERFDPFQRVGIYIPGGTAPLVSTSVMTCVLARVAGVPEIVATTPADQSGRIHPQLLAALTLCGATEIYRVGGAQAIGALAFGTKTIAPVDKIFGPGNAWVVEAKRQVFGRVAIDLLPGPSEIFVVADDSANAAWVAADLLAQAEHGEGSESILASPSLALVESVRDAVRVQLAALTRQAALEKSLENCRLIEAESLEAAVELGNRYAPEHLSLAVKNARKWARKVRNAGAIFVGGISPVVGGDFLAGPSHELPTGGSAKSFAGLTVDQFQRRTSIVEFDKVSLKRSLSAVRAFAEAEGLDAHRRSAEIRFEG